MKQRRKKYNINHQATTTTMLKAAHKKTSNPKWENDWPNLCGEHSHHFSLHCGSVFFSRMILNQLWNKASVRVHLNSIICNRAFSAISTLSGISNFIVYGCLVVVVGWLVVPQHTRLFHVLLIAKRHFDTINNRISCFR